MKNSILETYEKRQAKFSADLNETVSKINLISNLRLACAVLFFIFLYFSFNNNSLLLVTGAVLVAFFLLIKRHAVLFDQRTHLQNLARLNEVELSILKGKTDAVPSGREFVDALHPYTHDLDIFGEGSVYQYVNRCNTLNGQKKLAASLAQPLHNKELIIENQNNIRDLSPRLDFRQHFQASGMEVGETPEDVPQLMAWLSHEPFIRNKKTLGVLLVVIPLFTLLSLGLTVFIPNFKAILFILIIVQWIFAAFYLKRVNIYHDYISRKKNILLKYSRLLYYLEKEEFSSGTLKEISTQAHEAHESVKKLASLVSALDARTNALAAVFVNSFLMYDLQCVYRLENWKENNKEKLPRWLNGITETEVLNSFGTFYYNNPQFQFASIVDELSIQAQDLAHPLLDENERVSNSLDLGPSPSVLIVTGANMAGKSTFLRTLGVNLVLALNGAPVCASFFKCPIINLRSGMRTADSLKDHQSYFFAELNRLKTIMDELRSNKPLLVLLDEILKGTNSNDKQTGSIALVKQLLPHPCLALIATHDLALGELQEEFPSQIKNYCFEATIENDILSFDYKLKEGLAQKMNASFLMKKMGIIPG